MTAITNPTPVVNEARLNRAQHRSNHDWVRMINRHWGRVVARVAPDKYSLSGDIIVSDQPWDRGFPPGWRT